MQTLIFLESPGGMGSTLMPLFYIAIAFVFWFFILRPQSKRAKEQASFASSLEKGQEVVSASGMLGRISKIEGDIVTLEVGTKTYIRMTKSAISKDLTEQVHGKDVKKGPIETQD